MTRTKFFHPNHDRVWKFFTNQSTFDFRFSTGPYLKNYNRTLRRNLRPDLHWKKFDSSWSKMNPDPGTLFPTPPLISPSFTVDIPPLQNPLLDSADPAFHPYPSRVTDPANAPDLSRVADPAKSPWPVSGSPKSFHEISLTEKHHSPSKNQILKYPLRSVIDLFQEKFTDYWTKYRY